MITEIKMTQIVDVVTKILVAVFTQMRVVEKIAAVTMKDFVVVMKEEILVVG